MKKHKRTENQQRILDGMALIPARLIEFKKKMNSVLVVMKDGEIVFIKPEDYVLKRRDN